MIENNIKHWSIQRIKDIGILRLGKMLMDKPQEGYSLRPYLKSRNIGWLNLNLDNVDEMFFNKKEMSQLRINSNDLLISEGGEVGKTCIWNDKIDECYIQNSVHKLSLYNGYDPRYYLYYSFNLGHCGYYKSIVNLVSIMHLTYEKLRRVEVLVPPTAKQHEISNYLDVHTNSIDQRVSLLSKKRDCYVRLKSSTIKCTVTRGLDSDIELKESGIDWIEEIPKHWKIKRIKDIVNYMKSGGTPSAGNPDLYIDNGIPWVSIADMSSTDFVRVTNKTLSQKGIEEKSLEIFPSGTLLYSIYASIGKVSELAIPATINQAILALKLNPEYCKKYVKYMLKAMEDYAFKNANGNTQYNLNASIVNNFYILNPPLEEQQSIATYLDEKCAKIDAAVANIEKQIEAMKRLKRALINEVVTGKREV